MKQTTRREFLQKTSAGAVGASLISITEGCTKMPKTKMDGHQRLNLAMASYTFREFGLEETIDMTRRLGLTRIAFKSFHLPLESTMEEIKRVSATVHQADLDLYGCGVVYMRDEHEVHRAFEYAKAAGMRVIIGVPEHHLLELVNKKVVEYDIKLAIHNHGPGDERYPSPESAYEKIKDLDPRMGLCIDIGHTKRIGLDPTEAVETFADRLHDVHIKDVSSATEDGGTIEIGRGVIDIPRFLQMLLKINYTGMVSFEYEKDGQDPLPGVAESVGYVKGVLSVI